MAVLKSRESLAVKYRPKRLEQMVGQDQIVSLLQGQFKSKGGINRSFLVSGPTGCGKCITAGSLVLTADGFYPIEALITPDDKEGFTERGVAVCNRDGKFETTTHTFYEKTNSTIRVTTASGYHIEGTEEHKLLCFSDDLTPVWKRLDEITDGDYVAIQRGMQLWPTTCPSLTDFDCSSYRVEKFSCVDCVQTCKGEICDSFTPIDTVTCRLCGESLGNLNMHVPLHGFTPQQYKDIYDAPLLAPSIIYNANKYEDFYVPDVMTEDLATLLGYIVAEATVGDRDIKFYNKDKEILKDFKERYARTFKAEVGEAIDSKGVVKLTISGIKRMRFFQWLGVTTGHSRERCIPSSILRSPKHIVVAFLRAYFEGDGGWEGGRISATSASEVLITQLQTLLLNFGIVATRHSKKTDGVKYWRLGIFSSDVDIFMHEIGFISSYKSGYQKLKRNTNSDVIPRIGLYLNKLKQQFRVSKNGTYLIDDKEIKININSQYRQNWGYDYVGEYLSGNEGHTLLQYFPEHYNKIFSLYKNRYYWSKVETVEVLQEEKYVYDVSLPETHSFFSNGFISHNTTLGRMMAHYINCEQFDAELCAPCGECAYCKDVTRGYYGGVEEINFSDTRGVDTVRAVIDSTAYASPFNAHVFICDEIHSLTGIAQNAFLKILEEPPEGVVFILLTTDPQKLLPTIINRCCPLTVEKIEPPEIAQYLHKICQLEKRDYFTPKKLPDDPDEAAKLIEESRTIFRNIAMFSNGLMRQALATLEAVLSMVEGGDRFDPRDVEPIRKIVGRFVDQPETETTIASYLISGLYSGRYGITLSYALKLLQTSQGSVKNLFERIIDSHMQTLYYLVDPNRKIGNLTDPFYSRWYGSILEQVKIAGGFQLTHQSAAEIVGIMMELISELGSFIHDDRRLVISYTLRMLDAINKNRHVAYTKASVFHKTHAADLLIDVKREE
jgi:intein/homing endonuclease/replication-associated recombination protein RarA